MMWYSISSRRGVLVTLAFVLVAGIAGVQCEDGDVVQLGPPARFAVTVTAKGAVHLSWHSPLDDDDATTDKYKLQRSKSPHFTGLVHVLQEANVKTYTDEEVELGTRYFYRVAAHNGGGYGQWATLDVTPLGAKAVPVQASTTGTTPGSDGGSTLIRGFRTPCPLDCSGNGLCQRSTQECRCVQGFIGAACNVAAPLPASQSNNNNNNNNNNDNSDEEGSGDGDEDSTDDSGGSDTSDSDTSSGEPAYCAKMCEAGCTFTCRRYCTDTCPRTNTAPPILCSSKCGEGKCSAPCSKMCAEQCPEVGQLSLTDSSLLPGGKRHMEQAKLARDQAKLAHTEEQLHKTEEAEARVTVQKLGGGSTVSSQGSPVGSGKVVKCSKRGSDGSCLEFKWNLPGA